MQQLLLSALSIIKELVMDIRSRFSSPDIQTQATSVTTFSSQVYTWLTSGLGLTALIAFLAYRNSWYIQLLPYNMLIVLAAFGLSMVINLGINRISFPVAGALFMGYSLLQGLLFGTILPLYAIQYGGDIVWVAFATAAVLFATATIYGRVTRQDLTHMSQLLNFGVIALMVISLLFAVLSMFMRVGMFDLLIAYAGLAIFIGLIVTDSQQIRLMSAQVDMRSQSSYKLSLIVALKMYINVIMVFMYLLRIFASNRESRS
jgi:FtsH-binding integral membrane protein